MSISVESLTPNDWEAVRRIYAEGIATHNATFEVTTPEWAVWDAGHLPECRFVAREDGQVVGWVALSPYSKRHVYRGVAEETIYIAETARGRGVGSALMAMLIPASEALGIWTLQAGIFPENEASVKLHERCGFRVVGRRERLGQQNGRWRDVLFLERRSQTVGLKDLGHR